MLCQTGEITDRQAKRRARRLRVKRSASVAGSAAYPTRVILFSLPAEICSMLLRRSIALRLEIGARMYTTAPIGSTTSCSIAPSLEHNRINPPDSPARLELSVVMPCLNEERTVGICVDKAVRTMRELGIEGEVVIVDNGSSDRSVEVATAAGARVIYHPIKGYGNALRRGFAEAKGYFIIMGDCDDSYDFTNLAPFMERLRGGADVVMGNRLKGDIKPGAMPWL